MTTARLFLGDCREVLRGLPAESVHCVVTSPPYWSLRDYGIPPSVWGGDPACAHEWATEAVVTEGGGNWTQGANGDGQGRHAGDVVAARGARKGPAVERGFCARGCGAWLGALGLEPSPELWVEHMVDVFREVRRVLRADGTLWLNLGDSFWGGRSFAGAPEGTDGVFDRRKGRLGNGGKEVATTLNRSRGPHPDLKEKDLVGQPWMVAFALRRDGWWLRSDNVWAKPNPMPESVTDRPTRAHEYMFLLTKSARYYYDAEAIREPLTGPPSENTPEDHARAFSRRREASPEARQGALIVGAETPDAPAALKRNGNKGRVLGRERGRPDETTHSGNGADRGVSFPWEEERGRGKNRRTVWTIPPAPFDEAHFATYPPALVEPCIKAGTSERGACPACGAPWERQMGEPTGGSIGKGWHDHEEDLVRGQRMNTPKDYQRAQTIGWAPSCECPPVDPVPCVVADPFNGAATTGLVALRLGRDYAGSDVKREYLLMSRRRLKRDQPLLNRVELVDGGAR